MRKYRGFALGAAVLTLTLVAAACGKSGGGGTQSSGSPGKKATLTVGVSSNFPENQIVAEMYAQVLERAGYTVKRSLDLGTREISDPALQSGQIDIKPEYLGSELSGKLANAADKESSDPNAELSALQPLLNAKGITVLTPSTANDTNAFVVTKATADKLGVTKLSELAPKAGTLTLGAPAECPQRPLCGPGLKSTYGITFKTLVPLAACSSAAADALDAGRVDVVELCSTQPIIARKGWVILEDDKGLQPADVIVPLVRTAVLNDQIKSLLNQVSAAIDTATMTELSAKVAIDHEDAAAVAKTFLQSKGLL